MMKRRVKNLAKRTMFSVHKAATRLGIHILPVHYYSPLPDLVALERTMDTWARKSELPGLRADLERQVQSLKNTCLPYRGEYMGNAFYKYAVAEEFGPGFGYIEAQALHAVIRHFKPRRIIEVGSGVSTWCMLGAIGMNADETGEHAAMTCIEPFPSRRIRELNGSRITLIEKPVQTQPFDGLFEDLGPNDLLFIDSSHTVKPGSDVNYLILEILPRLRPGVIVHFHDVYLPYDYPRKVLQTFFQWMETSLLRAFLIHNDRAEILFCQSQLHYDRKDALKEVFPEYNPQADTDGIRDRKYKAFEDPADEHFPASVYIQIR